jgi:hypothetical protein
MIDQTAVRGSEVQWFRCPREFADSTWYGVVGIKVTGADWQSRQSVDF